MQIFQIIQSFGIVIGLLVGVIAVLTYRNNSLHQKIDRLTKLRERYWALLFTEVGKSGETLMALLPHDKGDEDSGCIPSIHRQHLLGFFKEVGALMQEGAVDKKHAFYLFAYFAIRCDKNDSFWKNLNRDSVYWEPFHNFVEEMRRVEKEEMARLNAAN